MGFFFNSKEYELELILKKNYPLLFEFQILL